MSQLRAAYTTAFQTSEDKSIAEKQLQRFYTEVLPSDLAGARGVISPFLVELADDTNLVLERRTSVPEKERDSLLARLRTTMVLAGEYEDIREFIYELETGSAFILIEEVILSQGDASDEDLVLTLGVSTYYWAGPDAPLAGATPDTPEPTSDTPAPVISEPTLAVPVEPEPAIPPPSAEVEPLPPADTDLEAAPQVLVTPPGSQFRIGGGPYTVPVAIRGATQMSAVSLTLL